jgi:hypothetical protein
MIGRPRTGMPEGRGFNLSRTEDCRGIDLGDHAGMIQAEEV